MEQDIQHCVSILKEGGIILYPTDTVWGLGCDATNEIAVQKIFAIKKRIDSKSLIILLPELTDLLVYTATPLPNIEEIVNTFTKPTTVIYPNALGIAQNAMASDGSVAIRICKDEFCYALLKRFRNPIISTSANISGEATPTFYKEIDTEIIEAVDYVVEHRRTETTKEKSSSIVKIMADGTMEIIRN